MFFALKIILPWGASVFCRLFSESVGKVRGTIPAMDMDRRAIIAGALLLWGCASSAPPPPPVARPFDELRRVAIVASGESSFTVANDDVEPGRTFDEILKWHPYGGMLRPVSKLVHRAISTLRNADPAATAIRHVDGISPGWTVARAMTRTLQASGEFDEVRPLEREPSGEGRPRDEAALVRVTVTAWGIIRVREGDPDLMSGFADVGAHLVMGGTGVVVWADSEDVTHPDPASLRSFVRDREFAREAIIGVLERAGQRLANELLYARSARQ
jgi:hypothetical protein